MLHVVVTHIAKLGHWVINCLNLEFKVKYYSRIGIYKIKGVGRTTSIGTKRTSLEFSLCGNTHLYIGTIRGLGAESETR